MARLIALLAVPVLAWIGWCLLLFMGQRQQLRRLPANATRLDLAVGTFTVPAVHLRAAAATPAPAILFAHGNAQSVAGLLTEFEPWTREGFHVFLVEYPGYAGADGEPTAETLYATWLATWDAMHQTPGVDPKRIVLMGRSLGTGPTSRLAARRKPAAVVLLSPFASTAAFAHARAVPAFLVRDRWDNVDALRQAAVPVLVAHGRLDDVIPPRHAEVLGQLSNVALEWHDCGHNDCPWDSTAWRSRVLGFLDEIGFARPDPLTPTRD